MTENGKYEWPTVQFAWYTFLWSSLDFMWTVLEETHCALNQNVSLFRRSSAHKGPNLVRKSTSDVSLFRSSNTDRGPILIRAFTSYRAGCFGSIWLNCCSEQNAISIRYVIVHPLDFHIVDRRTGSRNWILREQALQSILSSGGAFGWNTLSDRTNSPNSITPFCFLSKRSNTCRTKAETTTINKKAHHLTTMSGFAYLTQMCLLITIAMMTNSLCTIVWRPVSLRNKVRRIFITRSTNKFSILLFLNIASWNSSCEQVCMLKWACQMLQIRKPQVEVQKLSKVIRTTVWVSLPHSSKILDLNITVQRLKRSAHRTTHINPLFVLSLFCSKSHHICLGPEHPWRAAGLDQHAIGYNEHTTHIC